MGLFDFLFGTSGLKIDELEIRLGVSSEVLTSTAISYRKLSVKKRNGKERNLLIPNAELSKIQKSIYHKLLSKLKVHFSAKGFRKGESIVTNAVEHVNKSVVIKLDIRNFFATTSEQRVKEYFVNIGWSKNVSALLTKLCCYQGGLPQGASTSPILSNLINYRLDARLFGLAKAFGFSYTRYADDMTFSSDKDNGKAVNKIKSMAKNIVSEFGYSLNNSKQYIARQHTRQLITGLVVNKKVQLPRETRRWLRAVEHSLANKGKCSLSESQIKGWHSLQKMILLQSKI